MRTEKAVDVRKNTQKGVTRRCNCDEKKVSTANKTDSLKTTRLTMFTMHLKGGELSRYNYVSLSIMYIRKFASVYSIISSYIVAKMFIVYVLNRC